MKVKLKGKVVVLFQNKNSFITTIVFIIMQWSFRKTRTVGTLASQAEIGVWVQDPGPLYCGI